MVGNMLPPFHNSDRSDNPASKKNMKPVGRLCMQNPSTFPFHLSGWDEQQQNPVPQVDGRSSLISRPNLYTKHPHAPIGATHLSTCTLCLCPSEIPVCSSRARAEPKSGSWRTETTQAHTHATAKTAAKQVINNCTQKSCSRSPVCAQLRACCACVFTLVLVFKAKRC